MRENSEFSAELAEPAKTLPVMTAPARVGRPASDRWLHNGTEKDRTRDRPRILQELQLYGNWRRRQNINCAITIVNLLCEGQRATKRAITRFGACARVAKVQE
jgi:hypothetical protein